MLKLQAIKKPQQYQYIGTRIDDETKEQFTQLCDIAGVSVSQGLQQLIAQFLADQAKVKQSQ